MLQEMFQRGQCFHFNERLLRSDQNCFPDRLWKGEIVLWLLRSYCSDYRCKRRCSFLFNGSFACAVQ